MPPTAPITRKDPNWRFDLTPAIIQESWSDDGADSNIFSCMDKEFFQEKFLEVVYHGYFPDLSGIDDCSTLPEYTDIG